MNINTSNMITKGIEIEFGKLVGKVNLICIVILTIYFIGGVAPQAMTMPKAYEVEDVEVFVPETIEAETPTIIKEPTRIFKPPKLTMEDLGCNIETENLRLTNHINPNHPQIRKLAKELGTVSNMQKFVVDEIEYEVFLEETPVGGILLRKTGDCSDKAVVLASMLQANNYDAWVLVLRRLDNSDQSVEEVYKYHSYVVVNFEDRIVLLESVYNVAYEAISDVYEPYKLTNGEVTYKCVS